MPNFPVLFIHGIDDSGRSFRKMALSLRRNGTEILATIDFSPNDGSLSIEVMAERVKKALQALQKSSGKQRVDLVGFSMGGLVCRYAIQRLGADASVRRFISISAPEHGTLMAYLRQNPACKQMRPGSDLLKDLNADENPWKDVEAYSFWTALDLMIFPAVSSRLAGTRERVFWVGLHPWMLRDGGVIRAVGEILDGGA